MDIICSGCYKTIKTKNTVCENCLIYYHPSCTAFTQVRKNDKLISACRTCIATANASKQRRNSVKSVYNEANEQKNSTTDPSTASPSGSSESSANLSTLPLNDTLKLILGKLTKLDSVDARLSTLSTSITEVQTTLVTRLEEVSTRITNLEARLSPLEDLPILSTRLSTAEEAITLVQSEQANLCRQLDEISSANSVAARDVSADLRIEKLERELHNLNTAQRSLSNKLVICGLSLTDASSSKGVVFAALKLLDDELQEHDIHNVRKMRLKPPLEPPTDSHSNTIAEDSQSGNDAVPWTLAHQSSPQSIRVNAKPRIAPLIASLSSHALAVSLITAKIKMGKMQTSMLSAELLAQANASQSLPLSLINVNERLPPDIHQLRLSARIEAKKKGFVTFVRHGKIYIKQKNEDRATLISSTEELKSFLE